MITQMHNNILKFKSFIINRTKESSKSKNVIMCCPLEVTYLSYVAEENVGDGLSLNIYQIYECQSHCRKSKSLAPLKNSESNCK